MVLVVNENKITFEKDTRSNKFIILGLDAFFMSFVIDQDEKALFIKMIKL